MNFIENKCDVICNSYVNDYEKITNGYFVNEVFRTHNGEANICCDKYLYISHVSSNKFCLATQQNLLEDT